MSVRSAFVVALSVPAVPSFETGSFSVGVVGATYLDTVYGPEPDTTYPEATYEVGSDEKVPPDTVILSFSSPSAFITEIESLSDVNVPPVTVISALSVSAGYAALLSNARAEHGSLFLLSPTQPVLSAAPVTLNVPPTILI